ncbi:MAG: tetratricopeptide repeat protein, partial [Planctomycetota bacterium]
VEVLGALLRRLSRVPDWSTVALDVRGRSVELLVERAAAPDAPARLLEVLARLLLEDGDRSRGLALLRRVLRVAPSSRLRLELVEQLEQSGDFEEARREVERYLLHHPGDPRAARLLDDLRGR